MDGGAVPTVATVIPVLNEVGFLEPCLKSLLHQTVAPSLHMILVLDGGSNDGTVELVHRIIQEHQGEQWPRLLLEMNPQRTVAHARNLALKVLPDSVEFMVEMIGHATVSPDHLQQRLQAWADCEAKVPLGLAGVGVRVIEAEQQRTRVGDWVEGALASPLGRSGGQFSQFRTLEPTKVPAFVMHRREALMAVGGWDEAFITSQDSDLSMRLLKADYHLYRHPLPTVSMHKRNGLRRWWKMGHRYGFWRTKVLLKHPRRAQWQEFLPLIGLVGSGLLVGLGSAWASLPFSLYVVALFAGGGLEALRQRRASSMVGVPLCLLMLHASFSLGLVDGLFRKGRFPSDRG
jgi:GT2 family glycosyltransferase